MLHTAIPTGSCVNEPLLCDSTPVPRLPNLPPPRRRKAAAARPVNPALRLLPLSDFAWAGPRGLPRTRGDHVLIWVRSGAAALHLPRRDLDAGAGSLLCLPAGTAFAFGAAQDAAGTAILVTRDIAAGTLPGAPAQMQLPPDSAALVEGRIAALADAAAGAPPLSRSVIAGLLGGIVQIVRQPVAAPGAAASAEDDTLAARFASLARRQLGSGRTIGEMAGTLGCTSAVLDRACRSRHGMTALDLLAQLRLAHARKLLHTTRCPLRLIAHEAGFSSEAHLSRALAAAHRQLAATSCGVD